MAAFFILGGHMTIDEVKKDLTELGLKDNVYPATLLYLCGTVRRTPRKMSVLIEGASGYGKSHLVNQVLKLFPFEDTQNISTITEAGLMSFADVSGKILYMLEKNYDSGVALILREILSDNEVKRIISNNGRPKEMRLQGPTTLFETSTNANKVSPENTSRSFVVRINTRDEARKNILALQRTECTEPGMLQKQKKEQIYRRHIIFQENLAHSLGVIIPYAESIRPASNISLRGQKKFLDLLMAIAFIDQNQRERKAINGKSYIAAKKEDFKGAKEILISVDIAEDEHVLPQESLNLAEKLLLNNEKLTDGFSREDLLSVLEYKYRSFKPIKRQLDPLIEAGFVCITKKGGYKNGYRYALDTDFSLMDTEDLRRNSYAAFSLS